MSHTASCSRIHVPNFLQLVYNVPSVGLTSWEFKPWIALGLKLDTSKWTLLNAHVCWFVLHIGCCWVRSPKQPNGLITIFKYKFSASAGLGFYASCRPWPSLSWVKTGNVFRVASSFDKRSVNHRLSSCRVPVCWHHVSVWKSCRVAMYLLRMRCLLVAAVGCSGCAYFLLESPEGVELTESGASADHCIARRNNECYCSWNVFCLELLFAADPTSLPNVQNVDRLKLKLAEFISKPSAFASRLLCILIVDVLLISPLSM